MLLDAKRLLNNTDENKIYLWIKIIPNIDIIRAFYLSQMVIEIWSKCAFLWILLCTWKRCCFYGEGNSFFPSLPPPLSLPLSAPRPPLLFAFLSNPPLSSNFNNTVETS